MSSAPLEFHSPAAAERPTFDFVLDGRTCTAIIPKSAAVIRMARDAQTDDVLAQVAIIDDFLDTFMVPDTADYLHDRLDDDDDPFDIDTMGQIIQALQEQWGRRPPTKRAASSGSRSRTGKSSTARSRPRGSTRVTSPSTDSATS
jgi:hypothetical protein